MRAEYLIAFGIFWFCLGFLIGDLGAGAPPLKRRRSWGSSRSSAPKSIGRKPW